MERGGDVIPKVAEVVEDADIRAEKHALCFSKELSRECGSEVVRAEGEVDYRCVNADCPAKLRERSCTWAGRGVMNIEGLGEASVYELTGRHW